VYVHTFVVKQRGIVILLKHFLKYGTTESIIITVITVSCEQTQPLWSM